MTHDYGLELTQNSKVGWAFSLAREQSCLDATSICKKLCYGNGVTYKTAGQKNKRLRNYNTCEFLLSKGGAVLLAENLMALIDQARPIDWLAARISSKSTKLPYTLRIHDVGDFFSREYVEAWRIAADSRKDCKFWFYTRSFRDPEMLKLLSGLASMSNCQGFLSLDLENFQQGLKAFAAHPGIWKLALLQSENVEISENVVPEIRQHASPGQVVNFPYHRAGKHIAPVLAEPLMPCPQIVTNKFPLVTDRAKMKPCQSCNFCLP